MHLLAFGASLTEGFCDGGSHFKPYTLTLSKLLGPEWRITNVGISGEGTESMVPRLRSILTSGKDKFTHVVIIGGTNDLQSLPPEEIVSNLRKLCEMSVFAGAKPFVMTLPELGFEQVPQFGGPLKRSRQAVNSALLRGACGFDAKVIDLASAIPQASLSEKERKLLWDDDGVHFKPEGYSRMAHVIYEAMGLGKAC